MLTVLERRDTPAVPAGLADVSGLLVGAWAPAGYAETHSVSRTESHTVTVDQAGSGSAGTFTVDVVGSAAAGDAAGGFGEWDAGYSDATVETGGDGSNAVSYHLTRTGTYASGAFTITSETYTEVGSSSLHQEYTQTATYAGSGGSYTTHWDQTRTSNWSLSYAAAADPQGNLAYTSYGLQSADTAHWLQRYGYSSGAYYESTADAGSSGTVVGDGPTAVRTGSRSWTSTTGWYYPGATSGGTSYGWTDPVADAVSLPWLEAHPYGWQWRAESGIATSFTFRGVAEESATLTETARYSTPNGWSWQFDVLDFAATSHSSDSGHVVDDEPDGMSPGTGTTTFHRDEFYSAANDVTGSGSYVGGSADATYQAVQTAGFAVGDVYTATGSHTTGTTDEGEPYDLEFNFTRSTGGGGTYVTTYDYHDAGSGVELVNATYTSSAATTATATSWGTRNGVAFTDTSVTPDTTSGSFSIPGTPGSVTQPDGLVGAIPFRGFTVPHQQFYVQQPMPTPLPTAPVRGRPGLIQDWYNRKVQEIGGAAERLVTNSVVLREVLWEINNTLNGQVPRASGTFETTGTGMRFAIGLGRDDELAARDSYWRGVLGRFARNVRPVPQGATTLRITYAVDQATMNPRSGRIVVEYRINLNYLIDLPDGRTVTTSRDAIQGTILLHSPQLERMAIQP